MMGWAHPIDCEVITKTWNQIHSIPILADLPIIFGQQFLQQFLQVRIG